MPSNTVYSFQDLNAVFSHPAMGKKQANGEGVISIAFGRSSDMAQQDVAADGSVMTSKMLAKNGLVTVVVQQNSDIARWLTDLTNYLENSSPSEFARMNISASSKYMAKSHTGTGCSPQKMPDKTYAAKGGEETYVFMAQAIEEGVA